jgi:ATP-dependent helicase/nuclease subunit B
MFKKSLKGFFVDNRHEKCYNNIMKMIYGAAGTGKTTEIIRLAGARVAAGGEALIIVPEQFSFEFERLMYDFSGAKVFNSGFLSICSFSKLSERIFDKCGGVRGKYASEAVKSVILYRALNRLCDRKALRTLEKRVKYASFRAKILSALRELSDNRIPPEVLRNRFEGGGAGLPDKILDITDIYAEYVNLLSESGYRDEINRHFDAARIAFASLFFKGKTVFIDSFSGFTADEIELIKVAAKTADDVFITLPTDNTDEPFGVFESVNLTRDRLYQALGALEIPIFTYKMLNKNRRFKTPGLLAYAENLFSLTKSPAPEYKAAESANSENSKSGEKSNAVTVFRGRDAEAEAKFCAATIFKLCASGKRYSYGDIAVAVRGIAGVSGIFESVFRRYKIPLWVDDRQTIKGRKTAVFLLSFLYAACLKNATADDFIRIAKCGFLSFDDGAPVTDEDIDCLESFCYINDIKRETFFEEFTDPGAEKLRRLIMSLIDDFAAKTRGGGGRTYITALAELTERLDIKNKVKGAPTADADELTAQRGDVRTWNLICDVIADLFDVFGGSDEIAAEEFCKVFEAALADLKLASPPVSLNTVTMIEASPERLSSPKVLFICGANEGLFPAVPTSDGIFTENDIETLRERGIIITGTPTERLADERFSAYAVAASPTERLFITYADSGENGAALSPSEFVKNAEALFGKAVTFDSLRLGAAFFCLTPESTYAEYIARLGESSPDMAVMKAALLEIPVYAERLRQNENAVSSLTRETAARLYGDVIRFSATGIEAFSSCPFKFFAKYGLRIYPRRKNDLTANIRGGVIHDCLKNVGEGIAESRYTGDFEGLLTSDIKRFMDDYFDSQIENGKLYKSESFKTEYENIFGAAYTVSKHLIAEFAQSGFTPTGFEYGIGTKNSPTPPLTVKSGEGNTAQFRGIADRIDTYGDFIRVVDYKSFDKAFSYSEMYDGINLQPLFYIAALTEGGAFKGKSPAALIYLFSYEIEPNIPRRADDGGKQIKTTGVILRDRAVIEAMETPSDPKSYKFIPTKYVKKTDEYKNTLTSEEFDKLTRFSKEKLAAAADRLAAGECRANPLAEAAGKSKACAWCDYSGLCGNYPPLGDSRPYTLDEDKAKEKILGEAP